MIQMELLDVKNLDIIFPTRRGTIHAAQNVNLQVAPGEVLGLVGESGAGKSTIGNAIMDLLEPPGFVAGGEIMFKGTDLRTLDKDQMRKIRGRKIGMIFQDPQTSLNPLLTIGEQLVESIRNSLGGSEADARKRAVDMLEDVGIADAELRLKSYPHQFSGGMRQRVVIALAMAGDPDLIIADEPTTALDVSIQRQILNLIKHLCQKRQLGVILVTHDIGVIAEIADRVCVMHQGRVVETGETRQILGAPRHGYTKSLIAAVPRADKRLERFARVSHMEDDGLSERKIDMRTHWLGTARSDPSAPEEALRVENLNLSFVLEKSFFKSKRRSFRAVKDVSFSIRQGETFGIVGESGSGKSTIAKIIAGLYKQDSGVVRLLGQDLSGHKPSLKERKVRQQLQMIFQDPFSSLNARLNVLDIVAEPIRFHSLTDSEAKTRQIVHDLLDHVGLGATAAMRYPHEFSGGQRQRISIARALASRPRVLICDEPTSALDVSIQAQILNLIKDLQAELRLTLLFISHDLPVVRQMCDRVAVMQHGNIVETADTETLFEAPSHPYSQSLLSEMPRMDLLEPVS